MGFLSLTIVLAYIAVVAVVGVYGLHRYWMVWLFLRRCRAAAKPPAQQFDELPTVTVQLPMFNEKRVAERVIEAACRLEYPAEKLHVQVLDDSTDESAQVARACCERLAAAGHNVQYLHRKDRSGFKAGALDAGMRSAMGEFIAVFDADFVPPPDLLGRTIDHFTDDTIGMVQTRWAHLNRDQSLLTEVQAMFLDGHFIVEQAARAASGRWFNFNGTAGVWRRTCIDDAGGWQHDTLTEDTDLSYRAQLRGWRFHYAADVTCPAEIPPTVSAMLSQQHRWNKGLMQTAIKLMPAIWRSAAPLKHKIEAWFHLTSPLVHVMILLLAIMTPPAMLLTLPFESGAAESESALVRNMTAWAGPATAAILGAIFLALGACAAGTFYVVSQIVQRRNVMRTILRLPALMAVGVGVSVTNTKAVLEAMLGLSSPFIRTPKFNGDRASEADPLTLQQRRWRLPSGSIETLLGLLIGVCVAGSFSVPFLLIGLPFLLLFASGYLWIGLGSWLPRMSQAW